MKKQARERIFKELGWLAVSLMIGLSGAASYNSFAESARAERERANPYNYSIKLREKEKQSIRYNALVSGIATAGFFQLIRSYVSGRLVKK